MISVSSIFAMLFVFLIVFSVLAGVSAVEIYFTAETDKALADNDVDKAKKNFNILKYFIYIFSGIAVLTALGIAVTSATGTQLFSSKAADSTDSGKHVRFQNEFLRV